MEIIRVDSDLWLAVPNKLSQNEDPIKDLIWYNKLYLSLSNIQALATLIMINVKSDPSSS